MAEGIGDVEMAVVAEADAKRHLKLFDLAFTSARAGRPRQPLAAGVWFHDIFHADGRLYDESEVATIQKMTGGERRE